VYVAPAIPDTSLVVIVRLAVLLAIRIGGRRGRVSVQVMMLLMMIVQPMMVMVMMVMMMPVVIVFRRIGLGDLKLRVQRHARSQGEGRRGLAATGGRIRAGGVDGGPADSAGDRVGRGGGGRRVIR